jgi:haloalkane dehalogenase
MKVLRTPDERFASIPDFPYAPSYVDVAGDLRMHYVDTGPKDGAVVLMLHGEPTWSFLWRKVITPVVDAGLRAIAPDLVGFGRSDKPAAREDYTFEGHVAWVRAFVERLDLRDVTLVCQDWGGLIGLRLAAEMPERFARVVAANTFLPTGDRKPSDAFFAWRDFSQNVPELPVGTIVKTGCLHALSAEAIAAYEAPFPDESYKAGARAFPALVPVAPEDPAAPANRRAWEVLGRWDKPFLTVFGDGDPITRGADRLLQAAIPGAGGQPHVVLSGVGHFIQEDAGEELGRRVAAFVSA